MYEDKRLASKKEMEEIAWFLTTRKPGPQRWLCQRGKIPGVEAGRRRKFPAKQQNRRIDGVTWPPCPAFRRP
jgi:hypothetical protein